MFVFSKKKERKTEGMACYQPLKKKKEPRCASLGWRPTLLGFYFKARRA